MSPKMIREKAANASIHFAYEMVALTAATVRLIAERTGASFGRSTDEVHEADEFLS